MPFAGDEVHLKKKQRSELRRIARSGSLPAGFVLRAKIVLLLAEGISYAAIKDKLDPPRHAAVFCVDEKTAILALERHDRVLPLSSGRAERHGFESKRNGTLSLYAALNTQPGEVRGKTAARHSSVEFVDFLSAVVAGCEPDREIHIIWDNLSAHKSKLVAAFLDENANVQLYFTPTYSSWLNQVELWFSKLQRDVIARGVFPSTADLARRLRRYIHAYSKAPKPIRWKYSNPSQRIRYRKPSSKTVP